MSEDVILCPILAALYLGLWTKRIHNSYTLPKDVTSDLSWRTGPLSKCHMASNCSNGHFPEEGGEITFPSGPSSCIFWTQLFLGDLNHTLYNVWWWKSPVGIKRLNVWTRVWKCSICLILVMFGFFVHFWAVVDAWSVKGINFCFYVFLRPKNQYGWHGEI